MSRMLDNLRRLRDEVVVPFETSTEKNEFDQVDLKVEGKKKSFSDWKISVAADVEDISGMDIDDLGDTPWKELYQKGMTPKEAAQWALDMADEEDEVDEDQIILNSYLEEEPEEKSIDEGLFKIKSYVKWTKKLDSILKKKTGLTLLATKKVADITNSALHSIFMSQATPDMAANIIIKEVGVVAEDVTEKSSLRRRRFVLGEDESSGLGELKELEIAINGAGSRMNIGEGIGISQEKIVQKQVLSPKKKNDIYDEISEMIDDMARNPNKSNGSTVELIGNTNKVQPDIISNSPGIMSSLADSMNEIVMQEAKDREVFIQKQRAEQELDKQKREQMKKLADSDEDEDDVEIVEASVQGGDFGRWGPATAAVGASGRSLASALSKSTGISYKFHPEGTAQSSDVGSDLWFELQPSDPKADIYYLGIKVKGDKDNPTWDVMLKKGKGLGSSSTVSSQRGLETSELKGATKKLGSSIRSKE